MRQSIMGKHTMHNVKSGAGVPFCSKEETCQSTCNSMKNKGNQNFKMFEYERRL